MRLLRDEQSQNVKLLRDEQSQSYAALKSELASLIKAGASQQGGISDIGAVSVVPREGITQPSEPTVAQAETKRINSELKIELAAANMETCE